MSNLEYHQYYHRNLPHYQPRGGTLFITFRLADSLPVDVIKELKIQKENSEFRIQNISDQAIRKRISDEESRRAFGKWDDALHKSKFGLSFLGEDKIAEIVANSIKFHDGDWFRVEAYCIMPNHLHLVLSPTEKAGSGDYGLAKILHNIKRNSAKQANLVLGRTGPFWQHESYDRVVRDQDEFERIIQYVLYNPVKAELVDDWTKWKWSYCKYDL
jgi:putative transposase